MEGCLPQTAGSLAFWGEPTTPIIKARIAHSTHGHLASPNTWGYGGPRQQATNDIRTAKTIMIMGE